MGILYENIMALCESRGISGGKLCTEIGISKGIITDLKYGRQKSLSASTAQKIADYFGVTVGYLLGEESSFDSARPVTDDDLMYALFGGEATPAQLEEVKKFAAFIKARDEK